MGSTTSNPPAGAPNQNQGQGQPPNENNQGQGDPKPEVPKKDGQDKEGKPPPKMDLIYDETLQKYFDPLSGQIVDTPGRFEPERAQRPLRVKVRKRQHYKLRKRRRKPKPIEKTPSPGPPKAIRPATKYDPDGYAMYYNEHGVRVEYDEDGHLIPTEPYEDGEGYLIEPQYDDFGYLLVYDHFGIMVENDANGDPVEYDQYGYPVEFDENGQPIQRTYYPSYDEFGNELPPPKKKEVTYPDDGYDYDDSIYTYTTLESPPLPTPSPVSSDDVQEKDDSGDDLSMEDVYDFHWKPYQPVMPKDEARALIKIGGEDCNCYPRRSDPLIPSMVYDRIECEHSNNVIGHAHTGVARFDDNWNDRYTTVHRPRRQNRQRSKVTQVWGYPNKQFPYKESGGAFYEGGLRGEFQKPESRKSTSTHKEAEGIGDKAKPATKNGKEEQGKDDDNKNNKDEKKDTKESKNGKKASQGSKKDNKENVQENKKSQQSKKDAKLIEDNKMKKEEDEKKEKEDKEKGKDEGKVNANPNNNKNNKLARLLSREKMKQGLAGQDNKGKQPAKGSKDREGNKSRASLVVKSFLPRIGYTPDEPFSQGGIAHKPQTPQRTNLVETPLNLPPIAESPGGLSTYSRSSVSHDFYSVHGDIPTSRKFEGKYYDPVTKKTYTYNIKPKFGKHLQDWEALRQV